MIDAGTGNHLWSERYDREFQDIFAVQDDVTRSIVGALTVGLEDEALERAKLKRPESLQAYEHWLRGKRSIWIAGSTNLESRAHFERAIAMDPGYSAAYSGLAITYLLESVEFPLPAEFRSLCDKAFESAQRALSLDGADYEAHVAIAWPYLYRKEYDQAKKHLGRAIKLNPNNADTLANATLIFAFLGEPEEGIKCGESALQLNPRPPTGI